MPSTASPDNEATLTFAVGTCGTSKSRLLRPLPVVFNPTQGAGINCATRFNLNIGLHPGALSPPYAHCTSELLPFCHTHVPYSSHLRVCVSAQEPPEMRNEGRPYVTRVEV